jgi:hypothetical protein
MFEAYNALTTIIRHLIRFDILFTNLKFPLTTADFPGYRIVGDLLQDYLYGPGM